LTHLNQPSKIYALPNIMATYFIGEKINVRTAFSQSVQALHELTIVNRFGREMDALILNDEAEEYPVLHANKYMLGGGYSTQHFSFDAEFYYKKLDGLMRVTTLQPDPGFNDNTLPWNFYRLYTGSGWTAGMDLTAYYKKGKTDFVASYTLSKIAEQYDKFFDGKEFSPQEDRRHQVKLSGRYKMGNFDFSTLITYKSKAPYLSYIKVEDHDNDHHGHHGIEMAPPEAVFDSLPAYFSLDLGVDYSFKFLNQRALIGISLINATDHANVEEIINIGRISRDEKDGIFLIQKSELLGRTWNARFRIMF
ncbi:MAG TPA: TonB-dependent receptor, partial [Saprospiraceae bacterium]|nr:TonB-dependent receptor [Saprospiraceae bacterium]